MVEYYLSFRICDKRFVWGNMITKKYYIGKMVMSLADSDNVSTKTSYKNFEISSNLTRLYKYEGKGVDASFIIFINARLNDQDIPYIAVNAKCGIISVGKSDGNLKSIYETINKDIDGDFSKTVKIIKPGNFLWHNLVNGEIQNDKCNVDIYFEKTGHISGKIIGHTRRSRKIGKQSSTPFILLIQCEEEIKKVPINIIDVIIFKNKPTFENSQKGIITHLTTELLSNGHVCRGEPLAGYVIDVCGSKKRIIYSDFDRLEFFTIPELTNNLHDNDVSRIIQTLKCRHCDTKEIEILRHNNKGGEEMKEYFKPTSIQPQNIAQNIIRRSCWWSIYYRWCGWVIRW